MARVKISELNEKTTTDSADLLPMVDSISSETKKITVENLLKDYELKGDILYTREPEAFSTLLIPSSTFEGYNYFEIIWAEQYYEGQSNWGCIHTTGKIPFKIGNTYKPTVLQYHSLTEGTDPPIAGNGIAQRRVINDAYNMNILGCTYFNFMNNTVATLTSLVQPLIIIGYKD